MKGTGQCYFCLDRVQSINVFIKEDQKFYKDIYECGKTHLQDEIICTDSFDWSNSEELLPQFCAGCFESAQEIQRTSQELEKLQEILIKLIKTFKCQVKTRFSKNASHCSSERFVQQPAVSVSHNQKSDLIENIPCNVDNSLPLHTDEDDEFDEVSNIKSEAEKNDVVVKDEDSYLDDELDNVDFLENISGQEVPFESESEGEQEPVYILSNDEPVGGQWPRVIVERLQSDKNGLLIPSKMDPLNKQTSRKRNSAIKASDKMKKFAIDFGSLEQEELFKCRLCEKTFNSPNCLRQHEARHSKARPYGCQTCGKCFKERHTLKIHSQIHRSDTPNRNKMLKAEKGLLSCELCGKSCSDDRGLIMHFRQVHDKEECKCDICGKTFKNKLSRKMHVAIVHRNKRFPCEHCESGFKTRTQRKNHVDAVHKKILKHTCSTCGKSFGILPNLKRHEEMHKNDSERQKFKCEICGDKYFTQNARLIEHQKQWHTAFTDEPITCDQCHNKFLDSSALFIHSRKVTSHKQYKCQFCAELFLTRCDLLCHTTECHPSEDKAYQCKNCPIVFNSLRTLQKHSVSQHSISIYQRDLETDMTTCDVCGKEIKKSSLRSHKQTHLGLSFRCKFCKKVVSSKRSLAYHEERCEMPKTSSSITEVEEEQFQEEKLDDCDTSAEKMISQKRKGNVHLRKPAEKILCPVCGNGYTKEYFYQKHENICREGKTPKKTPTSIKNVLQGLEAEKACTTFTFDDTENSTIIKIYKCKFCDRSFRCPAQVKIHARSHTGEKPFSCETCGKGFSTNHFLTVHLRLHTGEQLFSCEICGKSFNQSGNLKRHMLTHTVERPHKCRYCVKSFKDKTVLQTHMRLHTGEKPYACKICSKSFSDRSTWFKHQKNHK